jgi:hypothetical protein
MTFCKPEQLPPVANEDNHHLLQTRKAATPKQLQGHRVFRRRRNVSRWILHQTTITAHLGLQGHRVFRRRRNVSRWIPHQITLLSFTWNLNPGNRQ